MNKFFTKIAGLTLGLAMAIGVGVAIGSREVTKIDATQDAQYTFSATSDPDASTYWSFSTAKNDSSSNPAISSGQLRLYPKNTITISAKTGYKLIGASFTCAVNGNKNGTKPTGYSKDVGTLSSWNSTMTSFSWTGASGGHDSFTITINGSAGNLGLTKVTISYKQSQETLDSITNVSATIFAQIGDSEWTIENASATGTISGSTGQDVTSLVDFSVQTAIPSVAGTTNVTLRATKKNGVQGVATYYEKSVAASVTENPFSGFQKVTDKDDITTDGIYALSYDGKRFAGNSVSNSAITYPITSLENVGYYRINSDGYLERVSLVDNVWTVSKYLNNTSNANITESNSGSSVWAAENYEVNSVVKGVYFKNTSLDNRFLGLSNDDPKTATAVKAYAASNLGTNNLPAYIYEVPQDKLDGLTISGQTTTFTAGSNFSLGNNAVLTAHYSNSGNTTDLSGGTVSYKINNVAVTTSTTLNHDDHNGKTVVITYTDAAGDTASTTGYTITVNYKGASEIELNLNNASLSIGATVSLTATIGDEYADSNAVSWTTSSDSIATVSATSGTKTITVTGVGAGNATITASANGHTATCSVSVTSDPILNLKDDSDNIINNQTLNHFTGDSVVYIQAVSENVASPVYNWNNEDDSVVTISTTTYLCEVTIVGAGSSEVSVTVGALTRTVTFSVTASGVTSLTLTSSVQSGELYDGTYNNTLTLTPSVTLIGNATGVINWSSSNTEVATVSSGSTTAPTGITVTGVGPGTATITAASVYTPARTATFDVSVSAEGVKSLTWASKPTLNSNIYANETTLGAAITAGGGYGTFTVKWQSGMTDTHPTYGTTTGTVHFALYATTTPASEGTPLASDYKFQKTDNGKYIVPFYEGKRCSHYVQVTVINWRSVKETTAISGMYDFSEGTAKGTAFTLSTLGDRYDDAGGLSAPTISGISAFYDGNGSGGAIQGSGFARIGKNGSVTFTFPEATKITSVVMGLRSWSSTEDCTISVTNSTDFTTSNGDYEQHTFTLSPATNAVTISSNNARAFIDAITINSTTVEEIGKSSDCLGIEEFIDTYLHMSDYTSSQGWCKDNDHNYYGKNTETGAKYHFNQLSLHQRTLLSSNSAYAAEWARLSAWAAANGESLNAQTKFSVAFNPIMLTTKNTSAVIIIVVISAISVAAIGGYFLFRKKKDN